VLRRRNGDPRHPTISGQRQWQNCPIVYSPPRCLLHTDTPGRCRRRRTAGPSRSPRRPRSPSRSNFQPRGTGPQVKIPPDMLLRDCPTKDIRTDDVADTWSTVAARDAFPSVVGEPSPPMPDPSLSSKFASRGISYVRAGIAAALVIRIDRSTLAQCDDEPTDCERAGDRPRRQARLTGDWPRPPLGIAFAIASKRGDDD
jgi:hypothetical protein